MIESTYFVYQINKQFFKRVITPKRVVFKVLYPVLIFTPATVSQASIHAVEF